jgi:ATP-dependent Lhr-like helicase
VHELIGNKRGVQVQLALARLKRWKPRLVVWGLSATLGKLDEAMSTLCGAPARLVQGRIEKGLVIDTLLPHEPGRFSWGGHLGAQMQQPVVEEIERTMREGTGSTLVFTNVRSQAEIWYQLLLAARPDWAGQIALHHGSLDKGVREWVEAGLKDGSLRAVVATSSLDLGVDFLPVERVMQIGSAKGLARLLQRAGRSGHAPGRPSRVTVVPTHTLELVEAAASREAALAGRVEQRRSPDKPLDVLVQHLVTVALGGGFTADELFDEVRRAWAYRGLTRDEFDWALAFVERGGASLTAYPEYHRVRWVEEERKYRVPDRGIALRHQLQVGTIVSEASMLVKWMSGGTMGRSKRASSRAPVARAITSCSPAACSNTRTQDMAAYVRKAPEERHRAWQWRRRDAVVVRTEPMPRSRRWSRRARAIFSPSCAAQPMLARSCACRSCPRRPRCWSSCSPRAKAATCLHLPVRGPQRAPRPGRPAGLAAGTRRTEHLLAGLQRPRLRAARRQADRDRGARSR